MDDHGKTHDAPGAAPGPGRGRGRFPSAVWARPGRGGAAADLPANDPLVDDPDDPEEAGAPDESGPAESAAPSDPATPEEILRFFRILDRVTELGDEDPESEVALAQIVAEVARATGSEQAVLSLVDPSTGDLDTKAVHGFGVDPPKELSFIGDGIHGWVRKIGTTMILDSPDQPGGLPLLEFERTRLIAAPLQVGSARVGAISVLRPVREEGYRETDVIMLGTIAALVGGRVGHGRAEAHGQEAVRKAIESLTLALDARDPYTRGHSQRVAIYSLAIANELESAGRHTFGKELRNQLLMSALLHDIGKIGIRDEVLLKPDKLTDDEYSLIKTHPEKGAEIVRMIPGFGDDVIEGILHHHERWDGKGYPSGQSGESIHIFGRIVGLADSFDAIVTSRPYSTGATFEFAMKRVEDLAGSAFDPEVVQAMLRAFRDRSIWDELGQISHARPESESVRSEAREADNAERTLRRIFGRNVNELPTLPHVVSQVLEKTRNSNTNIDEIVSLISTDQALVSMYLKLVNSAFYGFSRRITTLKQAITLLGFRSVRNVVVNAGVVGMFRRRTFNNHYRHRLWGHSVTTAVAARTLAPVVKYQAKEEAFTAGLLHDIGKIVIDQYAPKDSVAIMKRVDAGQEAREVETDVLGADHTQVGAWIAERWHLPKSLCWVIEWHHDWDSPDVPGEVELVKVVAAANAFAKIRRTDDREALTKALEDFTASPQNLYGFDLPTVARLLAEIWSVREEAMKTFGPGRPAEPAAAGEPDEAVEAAVATARESAEMRRPPGIGPSRPGA